jgi:hypothetical protein
LPSSVVISTKNNGKNGSTNPEFLTVINVASFLSITKEIPSSVFGGASGDIDIKFKPPNPNSGKGGRNQAFTINIFGGGSAGNFSQDFPVDPPGDAYIQVNLYNL